MIIDSNILIYAINEISPKHKIAQKFLRDNLGRLEITHQNILETIRVLTHKHSPKPMGLKATMDAIGNIGHSARIISPNLMTYYLASELITSHNLTGNRIFDAYLTATALSNNIKIIATDNTRDFKKFKEIKVINPFVKIN